MTLYAFVAVLVCWILWVYKMGLDKQLAPFVSVSGPLTMIENETRTSNIKSFRTSSTVPIATIAYRHAAGIVLFNVNLRHMRKKIY